MKSTAVEKQEAEDHSIADDEEFSTDSEYSGEDAEIQAAYKFGLLKPGLNIMKTKQLPGPPINNEEGLRKKLCEFKSKNQWLERMDVTVDRPVESTEDDRENDFLREVSFCEQAKRTVAEGIAKLHAMKILTKRPTDYFAEMAKSDEHMQRIRTSLMKLKTAKERSEAAKRVREEKRFAVRVQRQVLKARQVQKRTLADAVKKHQKGARDQLYSMLEDGSSRFNKSKKKRLRKDEKYGFGGRKKNMKSNTAESSADFSTFRDMSNSKSAASGKSKRFGASTKKRSKKQQRPGKSKRLRMKARN